MLNLLKKLFDDSQRSLDSYQKIVVQISALEPTISKLTDKQLAAQTAKFKARVEEARAQVDATDELAVEQAEAQVLTELLPEAFATMREAMRRVLGKRLFDVQLLAGIALHNRKITQQKTGEGKTLTVTAPLYLNALLGKGVHLVTVNDYLAEVGAGWMGPVYAFLGLSTAVIVHDKAEMYDPEFQAEDRGDERLEKFRPITRQEAYSADILYGTNNEFGFDYLRDNMVQSLDQMVQRVATPHYFAIVDEADSILIDEARTPLIISAPDSEPTQKYYQFSQLVRSLVKDQDFRLDEKARSVTLTDLGVKRVEQKLGVSNLYEEDFDTIHHVETALKASSLYMRDREYIVRDNQVIIVDEHTGRLMYGRRYSDGLHQAIEAKEAVPIQQESRTLATVSLQNYFRLYTKLSGMTGTAATEAEEFNKIYSVDVLVIPTNKTVIRKDVSDVVYKTTAAKYSAIVREIEMQHEKGRPILVGTRSIEHNEIISKFLKRKGIEHQVLNAKNHEREAFIIADAGKKNAITVATNIAGRGVDIVLGGAMPELKDYRKKTTSTSKSALPKEFAHLNLPSSLNHANYKLADYSKALARWQKDHDEVVSVGGLHIIGAERHESRRIDNQLRGRAGRQGDPGSTQFFVSLEDDIMRIFGGEQIAKVMDFLKIEEDQPIEHSMVGKSIESAQVKVEGFFFDQRKRLVEFDDVMNKHREIIYRRRRRLLEQSAEPSTQDPKNLQEFSLRTEVLGYVRDEISSSIAGFGEHLSSADYDTVIKSFVRIIPFDDASQRRLRERIEQLSSPSAITAELLGIVDKTYEQRVNQMGEGTVSQLERAVTLNTVDEKWMEHLDDIEDLREGIWLRGDKRTVLSEYKKEAFGLFEQLIGTIEQTIANRIFRVQPMEQMRPAVQPEQLELKKEDIHEDLIKEVADATVATQAPAAQRKSGSVGDLASVLGKARAQAKPNPGAKQAKIGRNDMCPCGSGLKYKKCGLIGAKEHRG